MAYDASSGGEPRGGWCLACKAPIRSKTDAVQIDFASDPDGARGESGVYHKACGKPFAALARVINLGRRG